MTPGGNHDAEQPLPGGFINDVVRIGPTVRRRGPTRPYVHELLATLEAAGWLGAPRYLGLDDQHREMLTFIEGDVPHPGFPLAGITGDSTLIAVAELVRQLHDLTTDTPLSAGTEVVCHNDLSPTNTVYRTTASTPIPIAFIDWDLAAPGRRVHDVAHICWQYLELGPSTTNISDAARQTRLIADAYGLNGREELVNTILWWQQRCATGILDEAESGDTAMAALLARGTVSEIQAAQVWLSTRRGVFDAALA